MTDTRSFREGVIAGQTQATLAIRDMLGAMYETATPEQKPGIDLAYYHLESIINGWLDNIKINSQKGHQLVTKHTRAGRYGKLIECPYCDKQVRVKHFSWTAMQCDGCKRPVDKQDWIVAA